MLHGDLRIPGVAEGDIRGGRFVTDHLLQGQFESLIVRIGGHLPDYICQIEQEMVVGREVIDRLHLRGRHLQQGLCLVLQDGLATSGQGRECLQVIECDCARSAEAGEAVVMVVEEPADLLQVSRLLEHRLEDVVIDKTVCQDLRR